MTWQSPYNLIEVEHLDDVTVVRFTTRAILVESAIRTVGDELLRLVKMGQDQMVIDFSEIKNMGSYMLATLLQLDRKIKAEGGRLVLCGLDEELQKLMEMTQLSKTFTIVPEEADAVESFKK
jgi:anti-sigma B factor antagonist